MQRLLLVPLTLPAGDAEVREAEGTQERSQHRRDLLRQFARGNQNDRDRSVGLCQRSSQEWQEKLLLREQLEEQWPHVTAGLAAAGGTAADDVAAGEDEWERCRLGKQRGGEGLGWAWERRSCVSE